MQQLSPTEQLDALGAALGEVAREDAARKEVHGPAPIALRPW